MASQSDALNSLNCPRCGQPLRDGGEVTPCDRCGARLIRRPHPGARSLDSHLPDAQVVQGISLYTYDLTDPLTGMTAWSICVPQGWACRGGIYWMENNPASPVRLRFRMFNPDGLEAFEIFPEIACAWETTTLALMTLPIGSRLRGNEYRPPVPALSAVQSLALPRYRGVPGLQVLAAAPAPELVDYLVSPPRSGPTTQIEYDAVRLRLGYSLQGCRVEEDFCALGVYRSVWVPRGSTQVEQTHWSLKMIHAFQASPGQLDSLRDLYWALALSASFTPSFTARVREMGGLLPPDAQRRLQAVGRSGSMLAQDLEGVGSADWAVSQQRLQPGDEVWRGPARSLETYYDPHLGRAVELEAGYKQVWSNAHGEYLLSDDASFDPNIDSGVAWTRLGPAAP